MNKINTMATVLSAVMIGLVCLAGLGLLCRVLYEVWCLGFYSPLFK